MGFLRESASGSVNINLKIKEEFANLDMINRYLDRFSKGSKSRNLIKEYYKYLLEKLEQNKTTIRSIRLSLTPAVKFLEYLVISLNLIIFVLVLFLRFLHF